MKKTTLIFLASTLLLAESPILNPNGTLIYPVAPSANEAIEVLTQGKLYQRLRDHTFYYDYNDASLPDHIMSGVGYSALYKSAFLEGLGFTLGANASYLYYLNVTDKTKLASLKSGKDLFSRYDYNANNALYMTVLSQYYLEYRLLKTNLLVGQQLFESQFTTSNDTKMIPNSFLGATITSKDIDKTTLRLAYFVSEKNRDHTTNHDVLTYNADWSAQDDSSVNKAITSGAHQLLIADANTKLISNLDLTYSFNYVNQVMVQNVAEATLKLDSFGFGVRGFLQTGLQEYTKGASLSAVTTGYTSPNSLNGAAVMAKADYSFEKLFKLTYGYSFIANQADLIAPWRGFPTAGYTRAMAQTNWIANTQTHMVNASINLTPLGLEGGSISANYAMQNFDDSKTKVQADSDYAQVDYIQKLEGFVSGLEVKVRYGVSIDKDTTGIKADVGTTDGRLEINYLF